MALKAVRSLLRGAVLTYRRLLFATWRAKAIPVHRLSVLLRARVWRGWRAVFLARCLRRRRLLRSCFRPWRRRLLSVEGLRRARGRLRHVVLKYVTRSVDWK